MIVLSFSSFHIATSSFKHLETGEPCTGSVCRIWPMSSCNELRLVQVERNLHRYENRKCAKNANATCLVVVPAITNSRGTVSKRQFQTAVLHFGTCPNRLSKWNNLCVFGYPNAPFLMFHVWLLICPIRVSLEDSFGSFTWPDTRTESGKLYWFIRILLYLRNCQTQ